MPGLLHFENISRGFQLKLHSGAHGDDEGGLSDCEWSRLSSLCDLCESHGQDTIDDEFSSFCRKNSGDCDDAKDDDNRGNVSVTRSTSFLAPSCNVLSDVTLSSGAPYQ